MNLSTSFPSLLQLPSLWSLPSLLLELKKASYSISRIDGIDGSDRNDWDVHAHMFIWFWNIWRWIICYANITYVCNKWFKSITFAWFMKWYVRLLHITLVCEYISVLEKGVAWMGRDQKFMALHISAHSISQIRKWLEFIYPLFHHFNNFHHFDHFHHFC